MFPLAHAVPSLLTVKVSSFTVLEIKQCVTYPFLLKLAGCLQLKWTIAYN